MTDTTELKKRVLMVVKTAEQERESWRVHWVDLRDYLLPRHGKNLNGEVGSSAEVSNRRDNKHDKIFDATHLRNVKNGAAGMHSGLTSPNRPWFKLATGIPELDEDDEVKQYLFDVEAQMYAVFHGSNVYTSLHHLYAELFAFGTGALAVEEDFDTVIRARNFTIGEYMLVNDSKNRADTFIRTAYFTGRQMGEMFPDAELSREVKHAIKKGDEVSRFTVYQVVQPRDKHNSMPEVQGRAYASFWFEKKGMEKSAAFLRVSGFDEQPVMAPRWEVVGDNIYGESPGMDVLADVKTVQKIAKNTLVASDKAINPPVQADGSLRGTQINTMPGGVTFVDNFHGGKGGLQSLYNVPIDLNASVAMLDRLQRTISEGLFADLFRMLQFSANANMTATEVAERQQEKLLLLGPVIERISDELLDPLIDRTFGIMERGGLLLDPPEAIAGRQLRIQYVSILAQAQKLAGITAIEQLVGFAGNLAGVDPGILDTVDLDEAMRAYGERLGVNPKILVSREQVQQMRQQRAEAEQQQQQAEQMMMAADGAKTMSETDTGGNNALTALTQGLTG
jgi:hypothetical protein